MLQPVGRFGEAIGEIDRQIAGEVANIRASVNQLRHGSEILERLVLAGRVQVVGAEYALDTGEVTFLD